MSTEENKEFEIKVRINITDFACDPSVITELFEILPDRSWIAGEPVVQQATNIHKQNGWSIYSPLSSTGNSIDDHLNKLKEILLPKVERFAKLPQGAEVELLCVIYAYKRFPDIYVCAENISFLYEINASIDIDVYDLIE